jgi:hypothetical protein
MNKKIELNKTSFFILKHFILIFSINFLFFILNIISQTMYKKIFFSYIRVSTYKIITEKVYSYD